MDGFDEIGQGMCPALLQEFGNSCLALDAETFRAVSMTITIIISHGILWVIYRYKYLEMFLFN